MADVEVRRGSLVTETKKTRKVKKTKRRESSDQGSEITITEIEQTTTETQDNQDVDEEGYVCSVNEGQKQFGCSILCSFFLSQWTQCDDNNNNAMIANLSSNESELEFFAQNCRSSHVLLF